MSTLGDNFVPIGPQQHSSNPELRYSYASSEHEDVLDRRRIRHDRLVAEVRGVGFPEALSPDGGSGSSSSDFVSIINVDDFGFGDSWSRQVRKYASPNSAEDSLESLSSAAKGLRAREQRLGPPPTKRTLTHDTDTLNRIGSLFSNASTSVHASAQDLDFHLERDFKQEVTVTYLFEQLSRAEEDLWHATGDSDKFIPQDKLFTILDNHNVKYLLEHVFPGDSPEQTKEKVEHICSEDHKLSRRMILAVLILIDKADYIDDFIRHNISDVNLPLRAYHTKNENIFRGKPFHRRQDSEHADPLFSFKDWDRRALTAFLVRQYDVLVPYLEIKGDRVCFYKIDTKVKLPFVEYNREQDGGHGTVSKVRIHSAHHDSKLSEGDENPFFALKAIYSEEYTHIRDEVRNLERFSGSARGHDHLIRLLMAFKHGRKYYLLFPWASGNLKDLWKKDPLPRQSAEMTRWLFEQSLGMAEGLAKIHHHWSWSRHHRPPGHTHIDMTDKDLGRHGDVKPENILCFGMEPCLVIADFGLTRFHSSHTGSEITTPNNLLGFSRTYRPPEFSLDTPVSQKCDIWSLGCLYLEFVTWYLVGYERTRAENPESFSSLRIQDDKSSDHHTQEDKFFNIYQTPQVDGSLQYIADVKQSVKDWIAHLRGLEQCSQAIYQFLDLIEAEMLVPDTDSRHDIRRVQRKLGELAQTCRESDDYCTARPQTPVARRMSAAQPAIGELRNSIALPRSTRRSHLAKTDDVGEIDLDAFVDQEIRDVFGVLEGPGFIEADGASIRPNDVTELLSPCTMAETAATRSENASQNRGSSFINQAPPFITMESTNTAADSLVSAVEPSSSFATTPRPTHRNSLEERERIEYDQHSAYSASLCPTRKSSREQIFAEVLQPQSASRLLDVECDRTPMSEDTRSQLDIPRRSDATGTSCTAISEDRGTSRFVPKGFKGADFESNTAGTDRITVSIDEGQERIKEREKKKTRQVWRRIRQWWRAMKSFGRG